MKIDPEKFGIATALAVAIVWLVCSLLVALMPGMMLGISGHMVHTELDQTIWHLTWGGVFIGLIGWAITAGIFTWLLALIYNRMLEDR